MTPAWSVRLLAKIDDKPRIVEEGGHCEEQVVAPEERQHHRHLVDPIRDEDAGGEEHDERDGRHVAERELGLDAALDRQSRVRT